jgi:hypothetical protein
MLAGCKPPTVPITVSTSGPDATGTVNAPLPVDTSTVSATGSVSPTSSSTSTSAAAPAVSHPWPAKLGSFAKAMKKYTVWFPKALPSGYKLDNIDIVELDTGTGLICDMAWVKDDKVVEFTQGSPKERSYPIESVGKVPWGTAHADIVHQDPGDLSSPVIIVYSKGGNFAELQGDPSLDALKAIAASMVAVK